MAQLNDANFLIWADDAADLDAPVPKPFRADTGGAGYTPVLVEGETLSFYLAADPPLAGAGGALALIRARDGQATALGAVTAHPVAGGNHLYASVVIPAVEPGALYYLTIGATLRTTTYLLAMNGEEAEATTTYCRFRHDRYFYGVPYHELPALYQQFRLHIHAAEENPEGEKEIYKAVTKGRPRTFVNYLDWVIKVETHHFDDAAHRAAAVLFEHKELELNGRAYRGKSVYKRDNNPRSTYNKGECELYDVAFSSVNRC